jgi:hypothetical protein
MQPHHLEPSVPLKTAEPSPTPRSTTSGLSPMRLARMHDTLLRHVDRGRLPGLVAPGCRSRINRASGGCIT